jgi:hypothetical protein
MAGGPRPRTATIARLLAVGDVGDGHRSNEKARGLLPEIKTAFGLSENETPIIDRALIELAAEVLLGAAWYTRKYRQARWNAVVFIAVNVVLVVAIPIGIAALGSSWSSSTSISANQYGFLIAQLSAVLSGVFALQKTLSAWYSQQQNYAGWYKCGADLKEIYYGLIQKWNGHVDGAEGDFVTDLCGAADKARHIMTAERIDYYTRLALPSFDVLDMLTASKSTVTSLVSALVPAAKQTDTVAIGTKAFKGRVNVEASGAAGADNLEETFATSSGPLSNLSIIASTTLPDFDQTAVDACATMSLMNASDILTKCCIGHSSFFDWFNATFRGAPALQKHYPSAATSAKNVRFNAFWNQLSVVFDKAQINALEFCALMAINFQESDGDLSAAPEGMPSLSKPHGGLAYAFDRIPAHKLSYNDNPQNRDALSLFKDSVFVAAHGGRAGVAQILKRPGGLDARWAGNLWPSDVQANVDVNVNGFVMQADFYKFRGRGIIQTTWRTDYKYLIKYILSAEVAGNAALSQLATRWKAAAPHGLSDDLLIDAIATLSTNEDWDLAFAEDVLLAKGVEIDSMNKNKYLNSLATDVSTLNADNKTKGSFLYFAAHINGPIYQAQVAPMMKAMVCGIAQTIGATAMARAPRMPDVPSA